MIFKCKICGGSLDVKQGERLAECEYCGVKQTIPSFIEPKTQEIYNRASAYLMHNEFDKAENLYNQILFENKEDADAYWNVLMCRYGVTYVKDPASGKYIPTCNRTLYASILNDENYHSALKYADEKQKDLYIENAQTIDDIQKGILAVSKNEKPFDIFISYKETDVSGARTKDSIVAQDLYDKLTAEGYKVFFSRITLEDKIGTEYEPYIYAALASSKVMITISSSVENIEAIWVKNEWSRFLSFAEKDSSKTLIPLYFDMDKSDLPDDFSHLSAYDMKVDGFEQDLIRGIKKLIPLPVMLMERKKKFKKKMKFVGLGMVAAAIIAVIVAIPWFMKLPEYNAAMQLYYDKNYPEATWAFDKLGGYRDSKEMKEKAELSWRKSLATVFEGGYYITPNGTVESTGYSSNAQLKNIEIDSHGEICSIAACDYVPPYLLYEDGYVSKATDSEELKNQEDWHDIVKISGANSNIIVGLRSDGKMVYEYADSYDFEYIYNSKAEEWLEELETWEDIVDFDYYAEYIGVGEISGGIIIGVKQDGTLVSTAMENNYKISTGSYSDLDEVLSDFSDVKKVEVILDLSINFGSSYPDEKYVINITALSKDDTVKIFKDGVFEEYKPNDIIDIHIDRYGSNSWLSYLNSAGEFIDSRTNNVIQRDVLKIDSDEFILTRNGAVYYESLVHNGTVYYDGLTEMKPYENVKVRIYDEWTERMK